MYKWDVSSFEACAAGVKQGEADLGPIEVLVNNAGITRDAQLHCMVPYVCSSGNANRGAYKLSCFRACS